MFWNALILATRSILRNKTRSFLTVLGIVIGVAAVIAMVNLGRGATEAVTQQIESLGTNLLVVIPGQGLGPNSTGGAPFDTGDAESIRQQASGVEAVSPTASKGAVAIYGNENWSTTVTGIDAGYLTVSEWDIVRGRNFSEGELRAGNAVCIIGESIRRELFGRLDPLNERIRLGRLSCTVVGQLEEKGQSSFGQDQDNIVLVPLRTFHRRISGDNNIQRITVAMRDGVSGARVQAEIEGLMRDRRRISAGEENDFTVQDTKEIMNMLTSTTNVLTALLGAVAAVSLLVGGIGIMNIMLVSVTERTREIGIRLAIGALERDVLLQFLVEAVVLSSLGGVVGIVLALVASIALADLLQVPLVIDFAIILLAFLFSAAVGIVFGYFPARRAATLNPIEALRHE